MDEIEKDLSLKFGWLPPGDELVIKVSGKAIPQPRPRFVNGVVISTMDKKAQGWKMKVRAAVIAAMKSYTGYGSIGLIKGLPGALSCDIVFLLPIKDKKKHGEFCTSKPDLDNMAKLIWDAMESCGIFDVGDAQIGATAMKKVWVDPLDAGIIVTLGRPLKPQQIHNGGFAGVNGLGF